MIVPELADCPDCSLPAVVEDTVTFSDKQGFAVDLVRTRCLVGHIVDTPLPAATTD